MTRARTHTRRRWSNKVTEKSHAMVLKDGVFKQHGLEKIAQSLKNSLVHRSVAHRKDGNTDPFRSAMFELRRSLGAMTVNTTASARPDSEIAASYFFVSI